MFDISMDWSENVKFVLTNINYYMHYGTLEFVDPAYKSQNSVLTSIVLITEKCTCKQLSP